MFSKHPAGKNGLQHHCKKCQKEYQQTHRPEYDKERARKYRESSRGRELKRQHNLKCKYNITLEEYDQMFEGQNGVCALCNNINDHGRRLCVDHDHKTGKIRGLLCTRCNTRLGVLEDEKFINDVKEYLQKY